MGHQRWWYEYDNEGVVSSAYGRTDCDQTEGGKGGSLWEGTFHFKHFGKTNFWVPYSHTQKPEKNALCAVLVYASSSNSLPRIIQTRPPSSLRTKYLLPQWQYWTASALADRSRHFLQIENDCLESASK